MLASDVVIAGHSLAWDPEGVFLGVVAIVTGLRIWRQHSVWWHHIMDWIIGAFAITTVPQFGAEISTAATQSWAAYGVSAILLALTAWLVLGRK